MDFDLTVNGHLEAVSIRMIPLSEVLIRWIPFSCTPDKGIRVFYLG